MIPLRPRCLCGESSVELGRGHRGAHNPACVGWGIFMLLSIAGASSAHAQGQAARYLNPPSLAKPNGYTHVVVAPDGRTVYIAGQVALDSTGQLVGGTDFQAQAEQVFRNLRRALGSVGGSLDDGVKTTTFVTDAEHVTQLRGIP